MRPGGAMLLALAAAAGAGCTPLRSTIAPPYLIDGQSFSAAELEGYAIQRCEMDLQGAPPPPNKFTTDGCSAYRDARWRGCCIQHDVAYWCGARRRLEADQDFHQCVREHSSRVNATLMLAGVRVGGGRFAPFPWRFGYGYPWPHKRPHKQPQIALTNP